MVFTLNAEPVTPPDVTGDRPAKQDKLLKKVAKTYGPFTEWEWIEFSKTPLQKRLFFLPKPKNS